MNGLASADLTMDGILADLQNWQMRVQRTVRYSPGSDMHTTMPPSRSPIWRLHVAVLLMWISQRSLRSLHRTTS